MDFEAAKNQLESFGSMKFYYDSVRNSLNNRIHTDNKLIDLERLANNLSILEDSLSLKIEKLLYPYNAILYHRYILLMRPTELCRKFSYSQQHMRRLIDKGIATYAELN